MRWIVGFGPGGGYDIVARLMAQWLSERLGQSFVIENRPGAGSNISTQAVVNAPPDGYTLLLVGSANAINATYYQNLTFNFIRDIAPVASITRQPQVVLANPSLRAKLSSSIMPKPIQARSTWPRPESGPQAISLGSCLRRLKAEHMAAPTNAANVKKALANSEPSTHDLGCVKTQMARRTVVIAEAIELAGKS